MIDRYDNWLSSPYDDHYDDEDEEMEDDDGEAWERAQERHSEENLPSSMQSPYYDGTGK